MTFGDLQCFAANSVETNSLSPKTAAIVGSVEFFETVVSDRIKFLPMTAVPTDRRRTEPGDTAQDELPTKFDSFRTFDKRQISLGVCHVDGQS